MAEAAKERGNALYKSGKFPDAVSAYDEAIAACARIQIGGTLEESDLAEIRQNSNIISITRSSIS